VTEALPADPFRPRWRLRTPSGQHLTVEHDLVRNHWRVSPGEYVRRRLPDALAQATGDHPDADWITAYQRQLDPAQGP
jgi:hypothetical protein